MPRPQKPVVKQQPQDVQQQTAQATQDLVREGHPDAGQATVQPMGWLGRVGSGGAMALTNPFTGAISINGPANLGQSTAEVGDTLLHELTHRKDVLAQSLPQRVGSFLKDLLPAGEDYNRRPEEMRAYIAQAERALSQGRSTQVPTFDAQWPSPLERLLGVQPQMTTYQDVPLRSALLGQMKRKP
jgi:hypothetical protein